MIALALIFISILIGLVIAVVKTTRKTKKIALSFLAVTLLIPVFLILIIKPAQQGKIFPRSGKIFLLFFEPKDLWNPLAEAPLDKNKKEYSFNLYHKYVGKYDIEIIFADKNIDVWAIDKNDLRFNVNFYEGTKLLFSKTTYHIDSLKGPRGSGLSYMRYSLPKDLPVGKELNLKIEITGNIGEFINKYGNVDIVIKKGPDL